MAGAVCLQRRDDEIDGKDHLGTKETKVPTIFGMNFQAVSVGQKLVTDNFDNSCVSEKEVMP